MEERDRQLLDGAMSPIDFEEFMISLLKRSGEYDVVKQESPVVGRMFDGVTRCRNGANEQEIIFEIKYRSKDRRVSAGDIQRDFAYFCAAAKSSDFSAAKFVVVTNTYLSLDAQKFCNENNIDVIDRDKVVNLMQHYGGCTTVLVGNVN